MFRGDAFDYYFRLAACIIFKIILYLGGFISAGLFEKRTFIRVDVRQ